MNGIRARDRNGTQNLKHRLLPSRVRQTKCPTEPKWKKHGTEDTDEESILVSTEAIGSHSEWMPSDLDDEVREMIDADDRLTIQSYNKV